MPTVIRPLHNLGWTVFGCNPFEFSLGRSRETGAELAAEIPPVPVPGSVQQAMLDAGLIPDWNRGCDARAAEWIENRHWIYQCTLPAGFCGEGRWHRLVCQGLDYCGRVLLNGEEVGRFANGFVPHRFDLGPALRAGENQLRIVFECPPRWLGQFGYTSQMREWKARFNYFWDWTSRLLQVGIWDAIAIESGDEHLDELCVRPLCDESGYGLHLRARCCCAPERDVRLSLRVAGDDKAFFSLSLPAHQLGRDGFRVDLAPVAGQIRRWYPNGLGAQPLYDLAIELVDAEGLVLHREERRIGFKQVSWRQNPGCRRDADPWWCHVNGAGLFLQGINWTPIRPNYADVSEDQYRALLLTYRDLGVNLLRVWGGATLERECFYRICDELGLMVWQEFPLSSSGIDNCPPDDPESVRALAGIARSYIQRRMHHASPVIWCGGNELRKTTTCNTPIDLDHPVMQQFKQLVDQLDPGKRFVTSTPSGPSFGASAADYGKGIHWAVNGPWGHRGRLEEGWFDYWNRDDSLLRSETGLAGPSSAELIRRYNAPETVYPCSRANPVWRRQPWWVEWDQFTAEHGREAASLEEYVAWGQERQRAGLAHAAAASKGRYPACGGFIIWMGHDSFPCAANTSIIDFDGALKPAAVAIGEIFRAAAPAVGG